MSFLKMLSVSLAVLTLCACAGSAGKESAASEAAPVVPVQGAPESEEVAAKVDPIKCERIAPTGSRISSKVCKRQSEWDRIQQGGQQMGEEVQRRAAHNNGVGS